MDFVLLTQRAEDFIADMVSSLRQLQREQFQVQVQAHLIAPFKDLLGNGTTPQTLTQVLVTEQLLDKL